MSDADNSLCRIPCQNCEPLLTVNRVRQTEFIYELWIAYGYNWGSCKFQYLQHRTTFIRWTLRHRLDQSFVRDNGVNFGKMGIPLSHFLLPSLLRHISVRNPARESKRALSSVNSQNWVEGSRAKPWPKLNLVHFSHWTWHLARTILWLSVMKYWSNLTQMWQNVKDTVPRTPGSGEYHPLPRK